MQPTRWNELLSNRYKMRLSTISQPHARAKTDWLTNSRFALSVEDAEGVVWNLYPADYRRQDRNAYRGRRLRRWYDQSVDVAVNEWKQDGPCDLYQKSTHRDTIRFTPHQKLDSSLNHGLPKSRSRSRCHHRRSGHSWYLLCPQTAGKTPRPQLLHPRTA